MLALPVVPLVSDTKGSRKSVAGTKLGPWHCRVEVVPKAGKLGEGLVKLIENPEPPVLSPPISSNPAVSMPK